MKVDYKVEHVDNRNRLEAVLQDLGGQGWHVVSVDWHPPTVRGVDVLLERPAPGLGLVP